MTWNRTLAATILRLFGPALMAGVAPASAADSNEPPKLAELRAAYLREAATAAGTQLEKYREALLRLERGLADQRDYANAIRVRAERQKAEQQLTKWNRRAPGATPIQPYPGGPITLTAKEAQVAGGVAYDQKKDALDGWKAKGAVAKWTLPFPLKAGGYDVVLEMACAPGSGGQVTIKEDFHTLTRTITPTKGWDDFSSQTLGPLHIRANAAGVVLGAITIEGDGLFLLRCVKLVPIEAQ